MKTLKQFINENNNKEPVPISVLLGRFNPPHNGHFQMVDLMKYTPMILIVEGKKSSEDKTRNPLTGKERERLIRKVIPNAEVRIVYSANLSPILFHLSKEYAVKEIMAGSDRIESYKKAAEKSGHSIDVILTPRVTSATKVREAIRLGDETTFKKLMPRQLHSEWGFLQQKIN